DSLTKPRCRAENDLHETRENSCLSLSRQIRNWGGNWGRLVIGGVIGADWYLYIKHFPPKGRCAVFLPDSVDSMDAGVYRARVSRHNYQLTPLQRPRRRQTSRWCDTHPVESALRFRLQL